MPTKLQRQRTAANQKRIENLKQAMFSVLIGACVAFLTVLFEGLAEFMKQQSPHIIAGMSSSAYWLAKFYRV